jgi:signal peptidase II
MLGGLAADQAVKRLLLSGAVGVNGAILVPSLADVRFTWNRGVSFSLLWQDGDLGRLLLSVGAGVVVAALLVWAFRTRRAPVAAMLGLIAGGALGNLVDRYLYGAVFDFLVLRLGDVTLFVCNVADIAITAGTLGLLVDSLVVRTSGPTI